MAHARTKKRTARQPRPAKPNAQIPLSPEEQQRRKKSMWAAIIVCMALLVVGWLAVFRWTRLGGNGNTGPFRAIFERVRGVFSDGRSATPTQTEADEQTLQELRRQVFPELESEQGE
jgi:flagellar basal body-associated protein FliL